MQTGDIQDLRYFLEKWCRKVVARFSHGIIETEYIGRFLGPYEYGERNKGTLRPNLNRSFKMGFQGATISLSPGLPLPPEIDGRFNVIEAIERSPTNTESPSQAELHCPDDLAAS